MSIKPDSIAATYNFTLTDLRKNILSILLNAKQPLKAYDILKKLKKSRKNAEPPTVYRVLDFFVKKNVIHRIESSSAYIVCHSRLNEQIDESQKHIMLLCQICSSSQEIFVPVIKTLMDEIYSASHFQVKTNLIEVVGICDQCFSTENKTITK